MIDSKRFERLEKFAGGEERWTCWSFDFKIAVQSLELNMARARRMVTRAGEMSMGELRAADAYGETRGECRGIVGGLCQQLVLMTEGEAQLMVKSVEGCDGFRA